MEIFEGTCPGEYGIKSDQGIIYVPQFSKEVAERVIQIEQGENPPENWEEIAAILRKEGFQFI